MRLGIEIKQVCFYTLDFHYICKTSLKTNMSDKEIKWGFIGCGDVTEHKSGPAFRKVEGSDVVAVMCRTAEKAKAYAQRKEIARWYDDAQELIDDPEVNAIYIATPPSSHATYAIMAMKAGKPVYIEKPLAATYEDCARINRVASETGVPCFVAYYRRYLPYFLKVKELIQGEKKIGKIIQVQIRLIQPASESDKDKDNQPWRLQAEVAGGGLFYDLAPHQFDFLHDLLGYILEASGYSSNRGGFYEVEDTVNACFQFEDGLTGSGSWSFVAPETAREDRIELIGTSGKISFSTFSFEPIVVETPGGIEEYIIDNPEHIQQPMIQAVVEHLQGKGVCSSDSESATATNWVLDRILNKS